MANDIEYKQLYQKIVDEQMLAGLISAPLEMNPMFIQYEGGKEIRIPDIETEGLSDYSRANGFADAVPVTVNYQTHTFTQDRGLVIEIDEKDAKESGLGNLITLALTNAQKNHVIPEIDAYRFSKIYSLANGVAKTGAYTPAEATIFKTLSSDIATVEDTVGEGVELVVFMSIMTANTLDNADSIEKKLDVEEFTRGSVNIKVKTLDGVPILRVPSKRFKNSFDFLAGGMAGNGFSVTAGALDLNWIIVARQSASAIVKASDVRQFSPEVNQKKRAWQTDMNIYHDLFIPKNKLDGVYVSYTPATPVVSPAFTLLTANNTTTITLTGGKFKTGVAIADLDFAGTDATALGAGTLVRTSDTVVTITHGTTLVGTDNVVTVKGSAQELQASSVLAVASTVS